MSLWDVTSTYGQEEELSYIESVDEQISGTNKKTRVFYFKSEDRDVIDDVINRSAGLADFLSNNYDIKGNYEELKSEGVITEINIFEGYTEFAKNAGKEKAKLFVIKDFGIHKEEAAAMWIKSVLDCTEKKLLFLSGNVVNIPYAFSDEVKLITVPNLDMADIKKIFAKKLLDLNDADIKRLVGMSERQIDSVFIECEGIDGKEKRDKFNEVVTETLKKEAMKNPAFVVRNVINEPEAVGLESFVEWLEKRRDAFLNPVKARKRGKKAVKGVLVVGVPGTGKTAMAVQAAKLLGGEQPLPLIELNVGRMQTKELGGSEERFRGYLEKVESMAPCVMLIDEVEKSFKLDEKTHEVRAQMFSDLLTWLQKRKANVFTFITANSITNVPDELLRDGRLSERFFSFMPCRDELAEILNRKIKDARDDMKKACGECGEAYVDLYGIDEYLKEDEKNFAKSKALLDAVATDEDVKNKKQAKLFTGANIEKIIEDVMLACDEAEEENRSDDFDNILLKTMTQTVAQGESGMRKIVQTWFDGRENKYKNASGVNYFDFDLFDENGENGKDSKKTGIYGENFTDRFPDGVVPGNEYDKMLFIRINERLDEVLNK